MSLGGSHEADRPPMRRGIRILVVFTALAALVLPMGYVFTGFWSVTTAKVGDLVAERGGMQYVRPLSQLIGALADAQSAAVAGKPVDAVRLRTTVAKVATMDRRYGAALHTRERWSSLAKQIDAARHRKLDGEAAYQAYGELNTSALALLDKLGHTSKLASDLEFDADATLLRLPAVAVYSGQVADLLRMADMSGGMSDGDTHHTGSHKGGPADDEYARAGTIAAALDRISDTREAIREGVRGGAGAVVEGPAGLGALDEFSAAVVGLLEVVRPAAGGKEVALGDADDASERARKTSLALTGQVLDSLDPQLADRVDDLRGARTGAAVAMAVGLLLAAVLLWFSLPAQPEAASREPETGYDEDSAEAAGEATAQPELIDARELLDSEELLHVGRAVRSTRGEPGDGSG